MEIFYNKGKLTIIDPEPMVLNHVSEYIKDNKIIIPVRESGIMKEMIIVSVIGGSLNRAMVSLDLDNNGKIIDIRFTFRKQPPQEILQKRRNTLDESRID
jgi:hypothetical protein